jgi:enoyl-CoA hydratase/carnithine racemase
VSTSILETTYSCAEIEVSGGVLEVRLHTDGGSWGWNDDARRELPELFGAITAERAIRALLLTGTGQSFCDTIDAESVRASHPGSDRVYWDRVHRESVRLLANLLEMVNEVHPADRLVPRACELASEIAKPRLTVRYTRLCLVQRWRALLQDELSRGLLREGAARGETPLDDL